MIVLGIDPGLTGGVSFFDVSPSGGLLLTRSERMPVVPGDRYKTKKMNRIDVVTLSVWVGLASYVFIEHVAARPVFGSGGSKKTQGEASIFNFGYGTGMTESLLYLHSVPFEWVYPTPWKKHFGLLKKEKREAVHLCNRYWPTHDFTRVTADSGRADATLIGMYGISTSKTLQEVNS